MRKSCPCYDVFMYINISFWTHLTKLYCGLYWNTNVVLTRFSSLAVVKVVIWTMSDAAIHKSFKVTTLSFQCMVICITYHGHYKLLIPFHIIRVRGASRLQHLVSNGNKVLSCKDMFTEQKIKVRLKPRNPTIIASGTFCRFPKSSELMV